MPEETPNGRHQFGCRPCDRRRGRRGYDRFPAGERAVAGGSRWPKRGVEAAEANAALLKAGSIICGGRTFIAGADISEFGKPPAPPYLPDVLDRIENASKPIVAAVHGTALGGGFEVALTAHYRIAVPSAKCGLPEIKLLKASTAGGYWPSRR